MRAVKVLIVSPARRDEQLGNAITANRWQRGLRELGHEADVVLEFRDEDPDVLIALHARRSASSIALFARERPGRPLCVALTGTDLYRDLPGDAEAARSLELATRLVVLQEAARDALPERLRDRVRVIHQSVDVTGIGHPAVSDGFRVCVLGHLRPVKDPLLTARAARLLPDDSAVHVVHMGRALSKAMEEAALAETDENPRYDWLGEVPRGEALRTLAGSRLHALTSRLEGGANAVGEATALGVPTVTTHIAGSLGLLGDEYPGTFPVGDADALAALLRRAETDGAFLATLRSATMARAPLFEPAREREAWRALLAEL